LWSIHAQILAEEDTENGILIPNPYTNGALKSTGKGREGRGADVKKKQSIWGMRGLAKERG